MNDQKKPEEDAEFEGGRRKAEQQYEDISRIMVLYKSQIDHVDLCNVSCEGLPQMLSEMQDYVGGEGYTVENPPMGNPGFQLAALSGRAAFGKKMIGLFDILHQITADPVSLKSIEAYKAAWIFEEALSGFEKRGKEPLLELGSLLKLLSSLERTCSEESWARDCQILEEDIVEWIEDGALE
ncbi:MAG: hypothetical protein KDD68_19670 [Bdellovibrionales bacterium]|nr:hypothetical protein [Bdellovibrionales bacterium]